MRALNTDIPDFSKIGLPDSVQQLLTPRGLMLVTGPTGSVKPPPCKFNWLDKQ